MTSHGYEAIVEQGHDYLAYGLEATPDSGRKV